MYTFCYLIVTAAVLKSISAQDVITVEAILGHSAELPCNVTSEKEDDKLNILAWYRNGSTTAFYSRDLRGDGSVMSSGGRYRLVESDSEGLDKLQILNVRASDAGVYNCHADFAGSPTLKTYSHLSIIEPPQRLWVIHENGTRVTTANIGSNTSRNIGPYYIGDTVHLFCVAFGGKPQPSLIWSTDQKWFKESTTPLSEQRVRSDLQYGPLGREDHGKILSCTANNNDRTPPLSIDVIIEMYLPPELVSVSVTEGAKDAGVSAGRVRAGAPLSLQCRVLGSRPLPAILWRLDDSQLVNLEQNTTIEASHQLVVSEIQLSVTHEHDESRVTCCVPALRRAAEQYVCAPALPLAVLYPPVLEIVVEAEVANSTLSVIKGSNISLNCNYQANPSVYQLIWFHEEDLMVQNAEQTESAIIPLLNLTDVSESDAGEYVCAATNDEGSTYSEPVVIDVTYPPYCEDDSVLEYGIGDNECLNLTCKIKANPEPSNYYWLLVSEVEGTKLKSNQSVTLETSEPVLVYRRPNGTNTLIYCWGLNGVVNNELQQRRCTFMVTDETVPRPPSNCVAIKNGFGEITITCEEGHNGGLQQKFKFTVTSLDSEEQIVSIINQEPKFIIQEPKLISYKFVINAFNEKGESLSVEITGDSIIDENNGSSETISAVTNITTLALSLCGGVALLALAACGLVLCAHERSSHDLAPRADPPLCAYNTDESNCETYHDSDDNSECNVRRTESFRRAMAKYPPKSYDVQRTSSFHSARYLHDHDSPRYNDIVRHGGSCRVHSLQNINRKREIDALCDHLVMHLPPETYNVPKPMNTFYTMPRKMRHKAAKEISDEASEITQASDGFSLPPPPDEFGTYRAATRIRDMPSKSMPTYTTIMRHNSTMKEPTKYNNNNVIISPMNTVGLPSMSGTQNSVYTYPEDDQVNTNPFEDSP